MFILQNLKLRGIIIKYLIDMKQIMGFFEIYSSSNKMKKKDNDDFFIKIKNRITEEISTLLKGYL